MTLSSFSITRRRLLAAGGGALALGACAAPKPLGIYDLAEVPAPNWQAGQRWSWQRTDRYTKLPAGVLVREVAGREGDALRMRETFDNGGAFSDAIWGEPGFLLAGTLSDFGPVDGRFTPPLPFYLFPLQSGKTWSWRGHRTDGNGFRTPMSLDAKVEGWDQVDVLGKPTRALIVRRSWNLGPPDPFRGNLMRTELEWYAPDLAGPVRSLSDEVYYERRFDIRRIAPGSRYELVLVNSTLRG